MSRKKDHEKRINELQERAKRTREGRDSSLWDYLIKTDPDMFEAYQKVYEYGLLDGEHLPAKYRELILIGILAFKGARDGVISHAKRAYALGITKGEMIDAAKTTLIPGGAPTFNTYLAAVQEIDEAEANEKAVKSKSNN